MPTIERTPRSPLATTGRLLTAVLVLARVMPVAAQPGMFLDGVIYATIARNMAADDGAFWDPHLQAMAYDAALPSGPTNHWHDAPPLGIWLESLLFRVAGDHFWIEKLYSVLSGLGSTEK